MMSVNGSRGLLLQATPSGKGLDGCYTEIVGENKVELNTAQDKGMTMRPISKANLVVYRKEF